MKKTLPLVSMCLLTTACTTVERITSGLDDRDFTTPNFAAAWARAEKQNADAAAQRYLARWSPDAMWATDRAQRLPEAAYFQWPFDKVVRECITAIFPEVATASVVFRLDGSGRVVNSATDQPGFIEECVASKTRDLQVSAPPAAGFLLCHRYTRVSGDEFRTEGCGPRHWQAICTKVGTSTRCTSRFVD
jgi:hypothetical protein